MVTVAKKKKQAAQQVTTTQLPSVRCGVCQRVLYFKPEQGTASEVLTGHYMAAGHTAELASA
jgi:hypothetical protein